MKRFQILFMVLKVPLDVCMLLFAAYSAYALRLSSWAEGIRPVMFDLSLQAFFFLALQVIPVVLLLFAGVGLYSSNPNRKFSSDIIRIFLGCSTGIAALAVYILFAQVQFDSRFLVAVGWGFALVYMLVGRLMLRGIQSICYRAGVGLRCVVVIGVGEIADTVCEILTTRKELGYRVIERMDSFSQKAKKWLLDNKTDELFLVNPRAREAETLAAIQFANQHHIVLKYSADLFATYSTNMTVAPLMGIPFVELKRTSLEGWARVVKRLFDVVVSLLMIVFTAPLMIAVSVVILFETGRPIIYKNERVGIRGKPFFTLKFRSMYQKDSTGAQFGESGKKAEARERELIERQNSKQGPVYKVANDPRVTPFGRWIRRWSIDELPQFFNVVKGEMSVIGPRPHQAREVKHYETIYPLVFTLKPGITGLSQISGRSDLSFEEEMRLDVFYTEKWTLLLDSIIFIKTPFILLRKRNVL